MNADPNGFCHRFQLRRISVLRRCLGGLLFVILTFVAAAQPGDNEPKNATEWFQRADGQMNLRTFGSTPFRMKVVFHAFPGIVLSKKESEQIISGDGTYEEIWVTPTKWRREVTFGSYHAIEAQSEAGRRMQASSDYEPSRVLMLLEALLYPIPRDLVSPSLMKGHPRWKIENGAVASLSYVKISRTSGPFDDLHAYLFLPKGELVQSIEAGIVTSWQSQIIFGGREVPRHFGVQGSTQDLLTADVTVEPAGTVDAAAFELPGGPAEPGMTLRPIHAYEDSVSIPTMTYSLSPIDSRAFRGILRQIIDRHGAIREVEILYSPNPDAAEQLLRLFRDNKFHPAKIDNSPCEIVLPTMFGPRQ